MADVEGMDNVIRNLSSYSKKIMGAVVEGSQKTQIAVVNHAIANHSGSAHEAGRFVTRTENLIKSIQPAGITITDDNVEAIVEARAEYAGYVEGHPLFKSTSRGSYPFFAPALKDNEGKFLENIMKEIKKIIS